MHGEVACLEVLDLVAGQIQHAQLDAKVLFTQKR